MHLPIPTPVLGGIALAALLLTIGALVRRQSYTTDLQAANSLAGQGQYAPAIGKYGQASGEWLFHDAAIAGQATAVAQASAIATIREGQVVVYAAQQQSRIQVAQQYDFYAVATATTRAGDLQAQATTVVQDRQASATAASDAAQGSATAVALASQSAATAIAQRTRIYAAGTQHRILAGRQADAAASHAVATSTALATTRQAIAEAHSTAIAVHRAQRTTPPGTIAAPTHLPTAAPGIVSTTAPTLVPTVASTAIPTAPTTVSTAPIAAAGAGAIGGRPLIYAAIGASEAVGVGADDPATQSWVADLSRLLPAGSRLVNLGKSGALLDYGLQSELPAVVASNPDVVTVWMVVNDINARISPASYQGELDAVLSTLQQKTHARVFVGNVPDLTRLPVYKGIDPGQLTQTAQAFNAIIAQVARTRGATVVDLYALTAATLPAHPEYISGDGFHPSTAGYADLATTWWASIRPQLPR